MNFEFNVKLKFNQHIEAENKEEAEEELKETFLDDFGIDLDDKDIEFIY